MIRQHFYPKSFFRHRSLSKNQCRTDLNINENQGLKIIKEIQCNQIRAFKKKSPHMPINQEPSIHLQTSNTEEQQHNSSTNKFTSFPSDQIHTEKYETNVLRQIHNRINRQNSLQKQQFHDDIKSLFIKSDRKEIIKTTKNNYRRFGYQNQQNQSFIIDGYWKSENRKAHSRKLSTADPSRSYKRSIERKKKQQNTPTQIIIQSTIPSVETRNISKSERRKEPIFQKINDNMVNLNLSKAMKFRQTVYQDKGLRHRKASQKIHLDIIQNRAFELQQKVRGWEIEVQDDIGFS